MNRTHHPSSFHRPFLFVKADSATLGCACCLSPYPRGQTASGKVCGWMSVLFIIFLLSFVFFIHDVDNKPHARN